MVNFLVFIKRDLHFFSEYVSETFAVKLINMSFPSAVIFYFHLEKYQQYIHPLTHVTINKLLILSIFKPIIRPHLHIISNCISHPFRCSLPAMYSPTKPVSTEQSTISFAFNQGVRSSSNRNDLRIINFLFQYQNAFV